MAGKPPNQPERRARIVPTIIDIAREAGVSKTTVSRVLNGAPYVSPAVRSAVLSAADRLGYRRNKAAASLRTSRSSLVGLIVPAINHEIFAELAERLEEDLREREIGLAITSSGWSTEREVLAINDLEAHGVDALVIALADDRSPTVAARLKGVHCPLVLVDRDVRGLSCDSIQLEYRVAMDAAIAHLASLGHSSVGLISVSPRTLPGRELAAAYEEAVTRYGCARSGELVVAADRQDAATGRAAIEKLVAAGATAAIIGAPSVVAEGALLRMRELDLAIPGDLSVIVYSDSELSRTNRPPLSYIDRSVSDLGRIAARLALARLDNPQLPHRTEAVPTRLVLRESTGRAPGPRGSGPAAAARG
jgi:LacI family transcriptional regulator